MKMIKGDVVMDRLSGFLYGGLRCSATKEDLRQSLPEVVKVRIYGFRVRVKEKDERGDVPKK
ncbi:hypothetical protein DY000_02003029 [Brassica cretica]|uniref:Uncharacterized protein n=1 Tax=Brassica cretica TaxID=69181 RepID=A0ABQ7BX88_BRACR|nr:hypothetical protein DY000_02003029 [Brassica cretica]